MFPRAVYTMVGRSRRFNTSNYEFLPMDHMQEAGPTSESGMARPHTQESNSLESTPLTETMKHVSVSGF